jgi:hypothetical protein
MCFQKQLDFASVNPRVRIKYIILRTEIREVQISITYEHKNRTAHKIVVLKQIGLCFLLSIQNAQTLPHPRLQILIRKSLHSTNRTVCLNYKTLFKQQTVPIFVTTYVLAQKKNIFLRGTADFRCVTWISHWVTTRTPFQACLNKAPGFYNPNCTVMICARLVDCWGRAIETNRNSNHCLPK